MKTITPIKRRNPEKTKAKILAAALKLFSEQGYSQTGLRDIAKRADVSSALLVKYFNTKAGLFEATLLSALELEFVSSGDKKDFGKNLVNAVLDTNRPITIPGMISLSISDAEAAAISRRVAREHIIKPVAKWLGPPKARARAYLILMLSTGFVIYNRHIILEDTQPAKSDILRWLENTAQAIADGSEDVINIFLNKPRK